jgi:hypothetical protein
MAFMAAPLLLKALAGAKGLVGLGAGKATGAAIGAGAFTKGVAARKFAGDALAKSGKFILDNAGANKTEVAMRIAPDLFGGVMAAGFTPGDLGDKLIAGGTQAAGGMIGGIGAGGLARKMGANSGVQTMVDFGGSVAGDFAGMAVGDSMMRMKGGGTSPWEKIQQSNNQEMRSELEREILATYGLAGYNPSDLFRG